MSVRYACLILGVCLALPPRVHAATSCTVTVVDIAFADYDVFTKTATKTTGKVKVKCTLGVNYTISLSAGEGTFSSRTLLSGSNALSYNLYTTSQHLSIWGDGTSGTVTQSGIGSGTATAFTVYGMIPALQNVPVGSYADTVTVTVTY